MSDTITEENAYDEANAHDKDIDKYYGENLGVVEEGKDLQMYAVFVEYRDKDDNYCDNGNDVFKTLLNIRATTFKEIKRKKIEVDYDDNNDPITVEKVIDELTPLKSDKIPPFYFKDTNAMVTYYNSEKKTLHDIIVENLPRSNKDNQTLDININLDVKIISSITDKTLKVINERYVKNLSIVGDNGDMVEMTMSNSVELSFKNLRINNAHIRVEDNTIIDNDYLEIYNVVFYGPKTVEYSPPSTFKSIIFKSKRPNFNGIYIDGKVSVGVVSNNEAAAEYLANECVFSNVQFNQKEYDVYSAEDCKLNEALIIIKGFKRVKMFNVNCKVKLGKIIGIKFDRVDTVEFIGYKSCLLVNDRNNSDIVVKDCKVLSFAKIYAIYDKNIRSSLVRLDTTNDRPVKIEFSDVIINERELIDVKAKSYILNLLNCTISAVKTFATLNERSTGTLAFFDSNIVNVEEFKLHVHTFTAINCNFTDIGTFDVNVNSKIKFDETQMSNIKDVKMKIGSTGNVNFNNMHINNIGDIKIYTDSTITNSTFTSKESTIRTGRNNAVKIEGFYNINFEKNTVLDGKHVSLSANSVNGDTTCITGDRLEDLRITGDTSNSNFFIDTLTGNNKNIKVKLKKTNGELRLESFIPQMNLDIEITEAERLQLTLSGDKNKISANFTADDKTNGYIFGTSDNIKIIPTTDRLIKNLKIIKNLEDVTEYDPTKLAYGSIDISKEQ